MTYKIIQWATGFTARLGVQALAERPEYDLVAGLVYDPQKNGRDLGEICGTRRLGVAATTDRKKVIETPADCVIYMGRAEPNLKECHQDVCDLLASGKNVIAASTPFIYPKAIGGPFADSIQQACERGKSTFHGIGILPGFVSEVIPFVIVRIMRRVERIFVYESLLNNTYPSHELMFDLLGYGFEPDDPTPLYTNLDYVAETWKPSALMVAEHFGLPIDKVEPFRTTAVAARDFQVASGLVRKGTVAAMHFGVRIISNGRPAVVFQHYSRMDASMCPDWPTGKGWSVICEGYPSAKVTIDLGIHGEDHNDQACTATAMHMIHAVPYVVAAKPGILTLADLFPVWNFGEAFRKL